MKTEVYLSPLDSRRFGIVSARAQIGRAEDLPGIQQFCQQERVQFLIMRCDAQDFASLHALEKNGYQLMDTLVWYECTLSGLNIPAVPDVRPASPADAAPLRAIAEAAFAGYQGHYHADPRLDAATCDAIYTDWTLRSLDGQAADIVLVIERHTQLDGFAALKSLDAHTAELRLYGIHPRAQKQGLASRLLQAALSWAKRQGHQRIITSTQIINIASQRAWIKSGFRPYQAQYTFHKWFDEVNP